MKEQAVAVRNPLRDPRDRRIPRVAGPCVLVIFGVTGDLARKKLMPAIYDLANRGLLPPGFSLGGFARRDWADQDFMQVVHDAVKEHSRTPFRDDVWATLSEGLRFVPGDFSDDAAFEVLRGTVEDLDRSRGTGGNHAFYLSVPPKFFPDVLRQLKEHGLAQGPDHAWRRVVNEMFEPVWNANYVDHVQITMAEDVGIGGRAGYYDGIGAARDVIQNHLLQLLALTAMEEPVSFDAASLRAEKEKVLSAVRLPENLATGTARGQYAAGWQGGIEVPGFLEEDGIAPDSHTETYAAVKLGVDTRRWAGVPFYLRTGKRLPRRMTEIARMFQRAPHLPFSATDTEELGQNALVRS